RSMLLLFADTTATFMVASVYYITIGYLSVGSESSPILSEDIATIISATVIMAAAHFLINSNLNYLARQVGGESDLWRETYVSAGGSYLITVAAALIANCTFLQFGLEFGLVVLPIAVIGDVAYAIHLKRLAIKTRQITDASRIHVATVEALATAIDARDQMGLGHVKRTQIFAIGIGEFLGLSESEISALRTGALLHDIGKLAVPDHILNKPETLTPAEVEKTKIHASVGASILEKVGFDTPVVPTVKYHHEAWDGSGYPEGLKGENIPLTARILAVADAYDTMRGSRPYRTAVSGKEACKQLRKASGKKFDPRLVKIFLENLDRLEAEVVRKGLGYRTADERLRETARAGGQQNYVEQIKLANREAFTLYELAKDFSSSLTLDETLKLLTDKVREFVQFDTCSISLLDDHSAVAKSLYVAGKHAAVFNDHVVPIGSGVTGNVLKTQKPVSNCDPWPDLKLLKSSVTTDFRAMIALPILADGKLLGAISLYSTDHTGYSEEHLRLVETITEIAAESIVKSQRHAETESHALTDPMSGLPNARSLQIQFEREVARAQRSEGTFQILMLDLDGFKQVNDTFGHKVGDKMLSEIGRVIKEQLREYDFLARYAGDEFVALVPDLDVEGSFDLCRRIEASVEDFELPVGDNAARVGVSIGWATFPHTGQAFDQLLIAADKEMYATKTRRKRFGRPNRTIPKPSKSLELDMALAIDPDDIDTVFEIDEQHIYVTE
ncbi:MAG TPA: diguanylate cyclase, partial [Pyrinomonadaceae bacterium]|nr:diguanylate cyclase [Pyrinomonadaceae bacterium]